MSIESDRSPKAAERVAMLAALVDGDVPLAYRLALELLGYGVPFDDIVNDVLAPVQAELGRRWAVGDLGVADEHAASAAVEDLLVRLGATAETSRRSGSGHRRVRSTTRMRWVVASLRARSRSRASECCISARRFPRRDLGDFLRDATAVCARPELFGSDRPGRRSSFGGGGARARYPGGGRRSRAPERRSGVTVGYRRAGRGSRRRRADPAIVGAVPARPAGGRAGPGSRTRGAGASGPRPRRGRDRRDHRRRTAQPRVMSKSSGGCCRSSRARCCSRSRAWSRSMCSGCAKRAPCTGSRRPTSMRRSVPSPMRWTVISSARALHCEPRSTEGEPSLAVLRLTGLAGLGRRAWCGASPGRSGCGS